MTTNQRLKQLEKRSNERTFKTPQIIEIYGTREDGTKYLIETWKQFIEAENILPSEQWVKFVNSGEAHNEQ